MSPSRPAATATASPLMRRLVLGAAFLVALALWQGSRTPTVLAQESKAPAPSAATPAAPEAPATPDGATRRDNSAKATIKVEIHSEPSLALMIFGIVAVVFLSPVLVIALILWYRMRKNRMLNETMLKLAEKGVVPPAEALGALAGNPSAAMAASPSTAPLYEQAKQLRRRAVWSDLRKGVIMGGIGLGLTFFSILDDGTPNSVGLVLLFVGIGYVVLWWFEDRQVARTANGAAGSPPTTPAGGTAGPSGSA